MQYIKRVKPGEKQVEGGKTKRDKTIFDMLEVRCLLYIQGGCLIQESRAQKVSFSINH